MAYLAKVNGVAVAWFTDLLKSLLQRKTDMLKVTIFLLIILGFGYYLYLEKSHESHDAFLDEYIAEMEKNKTDREDDPSIELYEYSHKISQYEANKDIERKYPQAKKRTSRFKCDGRQHCSQMRSCEEAKFFLKHCPNTKMDGNGDGVPCERQWCH